jgi:hypothetical protein
MIADRRKKLPNGHSVPMFHFHKGTLASLAVSTL